MLYLQAPAGSVKGVARVILEKGDHSQLDRFFLIAWDFWYRRNKMAVENVKLEPMQVVNHALELQYSFSASNKVPASKVRTKSVVGMLPLLVSLN